jgi:TusA-related sulfurtransferase
MSNPIDQVVSHLWNAGDIGCGRLVVGLKRNISRVRAGELLRVTAGGAAARIDVPAWCRLTGNQLICESHPSYVIRRKND